MCLVILMAGKGNREERLSELERAKLDSVVILVKNDLEFRKDRRFLTALSRDESRINYFERQLVEKVSKNGSSYVILPGMDIEEGKRVVHFNHPEGPGYQSSDNPEDHFDGYWLVNLDQYLDGFNPTSQQTD